MKESLVDFKELKKYVFFKSVGRQEDRGEIWDSRGRDGVGNVGQVNFS